MYYMWKLKYSTSLKRKRVQFINRIAAGNLLDKTWLDGKKVLEIGCAHGKDFIQFINYPCVQITGIDIKDQDIEQDNVTFLKMDAQELPFEDKYFDLCVSFGVLEHIQPIEKLSRVIRQIDRVSKSYAIIVPSISTILEPHTASFLWQLKSSEKKLKYTCLNYYSDEAWLQFQGFNNAHTKRYSYIPFFLKNTLIYKF
jgi:ubiquinone/menaquinone biosynthesis C-methylase UbiE